MRTYKLLMTPSKCKARCWCFGKNLLMIEPAATTAVKRTKFVFNIASVQRKCAKEICSNYIIMENIVNKYILQPLDTRRNRKLLLCFGKAFHFT